MAREERKIHNRALFRSVNERIADEHCREFCDARPRRHPDIRARPTSFLLVAGHEETDAGLERIIDAEQGYAVGRSSAPPVKRRHVFIHARLVAASGLASLAGGIVGASATVRL